MTYCRQQINVLEQNMYNKNSLLTFKSLINNTTYIIRFLLQIYFSDFTKPILTDILSNCSGGALLLLYVFGSGRCPSALLIGQLVARHGYLSCDWSIQVSISRQVASRANDANDRRQTRPHRLQWPDHRVTKSLPK